MEVIKWLMILDSVIPMGNIRPRILIQAMGNRYPERASISARKGFWHTAEIPVTIPVRRREPEMARHVIYRKKPKTLSGQ